MSTRHNRAWAQRGQVILSLLVMVGVGAPLKAQECEPLVSTRAQQDVQTLIEAVYRGDADTVLKYTHARVVQLQGGSEVAREAIRKVIEGAKTANMNLESLAFPAPPTCVTGGGRKFIIVPTLSVISSGGQRFESLNYQLGVAATGDSNWTYVEGSRVNAKTVQVLFPGFPKDYRFPQVYRKPI